MKPWRIEWTCHREAPDRESAEFIARQLTGQADGLPLREELRRTVRIIDPDGNCSAVPNGSPQPSLFDQEVE